MQAIANSLMRRDPSIVIVYLPTTKLLDYIISAIKKGRLDSLLKKFDDVDVLLLDDIQFIAGADKTQEIFHNIFNDFHLKKKQIVISSDRPPKELNNIADRLKSRFTL
jgi:chromosomal replication initiator protein